MTKPKKKQMQPKINQTPFIFKNENKGKKHILTLSGAIREKYWPGDECISAKDIRTVLDGVTDDITIKLNSPGGDVFQGMEIYNYLKDHASTITVEVTGEASSAATFILAGANKVLMNVGSTLMIHEASSFAWGNKKDLQKTLNALDKIDQSMLSVYEDKTGQSEDQIREWMDNETWFTAKEAVKYGFADEVKSVKSNEDDEQEPESEIDEEELECPHCGHTGNDEDFESDEDGKYECPECGYVGDQDEFEEDVEPEEEDPDEETDDLEDLVSAAVAAYAAKRKKRKAKTKNQSLIQKLKKEGN